MLPSIDIRLQNVLKAVNEVILPAIPADQGLARDQALLVIGHLRIIADQWRLAARYEGASLRELIGLVEAILGAGNAGLSSTERVALAEGVRRAREIDRADLGALEAMIVELGTLVDRLIETSGRPGALGDPIWTAVLEYGERQSIRERAWFAATKLDPDVTTLPPLADVLD